jgi:hypothetical protein
MKNLPKIYIILFIILLFAFLLNNSLSYLDPDLGWHLRVGKEILEEKQVPHLEKYLYPLESIRWVDHEWLPNLISYLIYNNFGYFVLNIFFALIPILAIIILLLITKKFFTKKPPLILSALLLGLGTLAMAPHLGIRMQEITLLFLTLLLLALLQYNHKKNIKILFSLFPLFMLWANLHGGFLIGFAVFGYYIFYQCILLILKKRKNIKEIFFLISIFILSILTTLITPYGIELYSFLTTYSDTFYMTHINEWLSAFHYPIVYYQLFYNALYATILLLIFVDRKNNNIIKNYNFWHFTLTIIFFILAIKSRRHFPLFFIISFPLMLKSLFENMQLPTRWNEFIKTNILINFFFLSALLLTILYFTFSIKIVKNPFTHEKFCKSVPCEAVQFLKNDERFLDLKLFNNYNWGGYLDWTWPEKKLFSDGRLPMTELNGHSLLKENYLFFEESESENKLNEYDIKLVLLKKYFPNKYNYFEKYALGLNEEKTNSYKNYLKNYLEEDKKWYNIYEDKISIIYEKK